MVQLDEELVQLADVISQHTNISNTKIQKAGTCSGTCLELLNTNNQYFIKKNETKCGKCLGSVGEMWNVKVGIYKI